MPDPSQSFPDDAAIPPGSCVMISRARLFNDGEQILACGARVCVLWPNSVAVGELVPWLDRIEAVALEFPVFSDGRAYSQARALREHHRYRGELRATGQVLQDQFAFMLRTGFDSFDVPKPCDAARFGEAVARYSVHYQAPAGPSPAVTVT